MKPEHKLFIIENPNNPTGQVIGLDGIRRISEKARSMDAILIVDEAYGDYMDIKNSAIHLIPQQPNVIVTRTFSKGFGMAGMRMGYAVASAHVFDDIGSDIFTQLKKVINTFSCNGIARQLAAAMLDSGKRMIDTEQIQADKQSVLAVVHNSTVFRAAETSLGTPILTLICVNQAADFDLQRSLLDNEKLLTVSCKTYDGFDANAVRIMLPKHEQAGMLITKLRQAQNRLK
jgi:histidinol-phosphate aminotransferase